MTDATDRARDLLLCLLRYPDGEPSEADVIILADALLAERRAGAMEMRAAAGNLHEQINPASDLERFNGDPGAGAMGAVIEYRDSIRALPLPGDA